ncbi:MAG: hypothetical protein ACYTFG_00190 [Planctomycetota bacterium]
MSRHLRTLLTVLCEMEAGIGLRWMLNTGIDPEADTRRRGSHDAPLYDPRTPSTPTELTFPVSEANRMSLGPEAEKKRIRRPVTGLRMNSGALAATLRKGAESIIS